MHLVDDSAGFVGSTAIVASSIPIGVGLGLSIQLKGESNLSCIFFGDGAIEEGAFYEAANFAVLKKLPVLWICENNLYSVYSPLQVRQPEGRKIFKLAEAIGIPSSHHDGNDVVASYEAIRDSVAEIRKKTGPQFLEFSTYRWREHCGPNYDNDIGYRTEAEFLKWKERDPIALCEKRLLEQRVVTCEDIQAMERSIQAEIDDAFLFAENSPFPSPDQSFHGLFKDI